MTSLQKRNSFILILTSFIWGISFVSQRTGGDVLGPYTFNSIRSFIGSFVLLPVIFFLDKANLTTHKPVSKADYKTLITGGISCGIILTIATNLQQLGMYFGTTAGKAGFLTACYILIVPILGIFLKKKCGINIWIGVALALVGLYLLCLNESFSLQLSDVLVLICAFIFSLHILVIDHFSPLVDGVRMSCIQFFVTGTLTAIPMFFLEMKHSVNGILTWATAFCSWDAWIPLLYAGIMSCGVGYTLQIIGQKGVNPTIASLLMSLESVFSVLAGWVILGEHMGIRELSGCALIFVAIVLAQLPSRGKK